MRPALAIAATALLIAAASVVAGEIAPAERRSGYSFMTPDTQAIQNDDTANPGMLWVLDGEALWNSRANPAARACADCHGDAASTMKGVAARYPALDPGLGRPVALEQRINLCRARHQQAAPLDHESHDLLALSAFVARQSRGIAISAGADPALEPFVTRGRELFMRRQRPAQSRLQQLPRRQLGQAPGGLGDHARTADRLSLVPAGMAIARLAAAPAAQLHDRHPRPALRLRRAGTGRARALSYVPRAGHAGRDAGGSAVRQRQGTVICAKTINAGATTKSLAQRGTTAVASISTLAAFSTRRTTWTSAIAG